VAARCTWRCDQVGFDDLLDAALGAVTALRPELLRCLPEEARRTPAGLPMEMVYRDG